MDSRPADRQLLRQDALTIGLIGLAHLISHFFQLSLAPLFPSLHEAFSVSYLELGSLSTSFYLTSGISQAFAGILVDRYGARPALLAGVTVMAVCIGLSGLVTSFWMFYPLAVLAGIGNSVFHPADFSVLSSRVSAQRLGRAYGAHAFLGTIGFALAPVVIGGLAVTAGWRTALLVSGLAGLVVVALLIRYGSVLGDLSASRSGGAKQHDAVPYARLIASPAIMMAFGYFLLTALAGTGFQTFSTASLIEFYGVPLQTAALALTAYLIGSALGILVGGHLADRTTRHGDLAVGGLGVCAALLVFVSLGVMPFTGTMLTVFCAGLAQGCTAPSRDILVKKATPPGATGKVFGFVYSGLDAGSTVAPLLFGALLDHHAFHLIFLAIGLLYASAIFSVLTVSRHPRSA